MTNGYLQRFAGVGRLYGRAALERLASANVTVVGLGGVGSWAVEALARSGIGALTLVDADDVCVSNTNRQLQALTRDVGRPKAEVLRERVLGINPECRVTVFARFFTVATASAVLDADSRPDAVVDAIDRLSNKCLLVAGCVARKIFVVSSGGCAGKRDPLLVRVTDMVAIRSDNLLRFTRKKLRREHGFPSGGKRPKKFGVPCVWSPELSTGAPDCATGGGDNHAAAGVGAGAGAALPGEIADGEDLRPNCEWGYGTAVFVSGAFGFAAAATVVARIAAGDGGAVAARPLSVTPS